MLQAGRRLETEFLAYDTTSVSSYSKLLNHIRDGMNEDHDPLAQINLAFLFGETSNCHSTIKRVTSSHGKSTPGVDGAVWKTQKEHSSCIRDTTVIILPSAVYHNYYALVILQEFFSQSISDKVLRNTHSSSPLLCFDFAVVFLIFSLFKSFPL